jgi:hypothetical protein
MNTVISVLEGFEKLAYKFLIAIIFIPKTIVQITVNPGWVPGYINGELKQEKSPFDEYLSPVILLLVVALIPALVINFLPTYELTLSTPASTEPTTEPLLEFNAVTNARSGSSDIYNKFSWYVEKIMPGKADENGYPVYQEIYRETYNEYTGKTELVRDGNNVETQDGFWATYLEYPDQTNNKSKSTFYYEFERGGEYYVNIEVTKFDPRRADEPVLESYYSYNYVKVPASEDPNQQITISDAGDSRANTKKAGEGNISDLLKKETTIFLALGLLLPPLLFAMASKLFRGEEISENTLRESFYAQCYYFSPLSLAIWATYYAWYFYTPDVFFYRADATSQQLLLLPSILSALWFISAETQAVAQERQILPWKAFLIVIGCSGLIGAAGYLLSLFEQPFSPIQDELRLLTILSYPLISAILMLAFGFAWFRRRKTEYQTVRPRDFAVIVLPLLLAIFASNIITYFMNASSYVPVTSGDGSASVGDAVLATESATIDVPEQPTATELPAPTETVVVPTSEEVVATNPDGEQFYSEEFDGNLDRWNPYVSDENAVIITPGNGILDFQISPKGDKYPYGYMTNTAFTYTDVRVDAIATNNGNNTNATILFCRSSNSGWYEFSFSNGGTYSITAYDSSGNGKELASGGSAAIKPGKVTNSVTALCVGNELSLLINDSLVKTVTDTEFNFTEGTIGIGVSSPQLLPVDVQFESVTVSAP